MPQPPDTAILAHEDVRVIPGLAQHVFFDAAAGALETYIWEFDQAARVTDFNQFLSGLPTPAAPANSTTTIAGGAGPQTTPQPALGIFLDALAFTSGVGGALLTVEYAVDASPCSYRTFAVTIVPASTLTNISGLRVTGRFVRCTLQNITVGATVEFGIYIRNL